MLSVTGVFHVTCTTLEEADGLSAMLLDAPSNEIESWSRDGLEFGLTITASIEPPVVQ